MKLRALVATSEAVAATRSRTEKVTRLAACLAELAPDEVALGAAVLAGRLPERLGVGRAALTAAARVPPAAEAGLTLGELAGALAELGALSGPGAARRRA